jgi:DNA polymerase-3 subunit gamma/tau
LNEAEINYRQARNKRLHVELTLIKLCYLQQALELVNEGDHLHKKKQIDSVKPVAFKSITPIAVKEKDISQVSSKASAQANGKLIVSANGNGQLHKEKATLVIQKPEISKAAQDHTLVANVRPQTKMKKLGSLEKIRQQVALENKENGNNVIELSEEELYVAWGLYIEELRKNNNHSAVSNFKSAQLSIIDSNCVEIITENNIQQKFVEAERAALIEHLQTHFNNRFLTYRVVITEKENNNAVHEKHLTTKEQYLKIIEEYPLVKELKDRLGLQLDY